MHIDFVMCNNQLLTDEVELLEDGIQFIVGGSATPSRPSDVFYVVSFVQNYHIVLQLDVHLKQNLHFWIYFFTLEKRIKQLIIEYDSPKKFSSP